MYRNPNFVKYRTFLIEAFIQIRDHDLFTIIVCVLLSVFCIHQIIRLKISVVSTSIDYLSETTKVKKSYTILF